MLKETLEKLPKNEKKKRRGQGIIQHKVLLIWRARVCSYSPFLLFMAAREIADRQLTE